MSSRAEFIGASCTRGEAGGFRFGHWTSDVWGDDVRPHGHDEAHLLLVTAGAYETRADSGDQAGPLLIYNPPGVWHADRFVTGGGAFFALTISANRFATLDGLPLPREPTRLQAQPLRGLLLRAMRLSSAADDCAELDRVSLCLELVAAMAPGEAIHRPPSWLGRACDMLRDRRPGDIDAVSQAVGVHPVHLARTFRRFLRCSPGEYRLAAQLEAVAAALARTRKPLCEIALDAGFADQSHLTRRFRAVYGAPPAQYRRQLS